MEVPQNTTTRTAINPAVPLLGIYPKECKKGYNNDTCKLMFFIARLTTAKLWTCPDTLQVK
jgi:hypothetical protein